MRNRVQVGMYAFHCTDPRRLGAFWAELMDLPVADGDTDDLVMLDLDHEVTPVTWLFHRVESAAPPRSNRIGLDLHLDGPDEAWAEAADRAEAAGATRVARHERDGVRWIEMLDPEGNAFRVFGPRPV